MFKYLKTLNSDSHPSEIISVKALSGDDDLCIVKAGAIASVSYGEICSTYSSSTPMYLTVDSKPKEAEQYIKCIRIFPGMLFEVDVAPDVDTGNYQIGSLCDAMADDTGKGAYITTDGEFRFEITDVSNLSNGKVTVVAI